MTTVEPRQQRWLGLVLILLAIFTVSQALYFSVSDSNQQDCVERKFRELSVTLKARSTTTERESRAIRDVLQSFAKAAREVDAPPKQQAQNREVMINNLIKYDEVIKEVQEGRKKNPLPPYPVGSCSR